MDAKIYTRNRIRLPKFSPRMSPKTPNTKQKKQYYKLIKILSILIIAFTFVYFSLEAIEPIIEKQCKNMAKSIATKISNNEATKIMENYSYNDMLNVTKDEAGNVKMVEANIVTINAIISQIPINIQEQMEKTENNTFSIKLGSFLGSNLFAGRGPNVNIKMQLIGNLDTDLKSQFISNGINQTLHRIYLEISCNIIILTPYETIEDKIVNQVLLAEGVIIGDVPSSYYNLEGLDTNNVVDIIE